MKTITIFLWCLVGLVLGTVVALGQNPTPIANLRRATTVYPTNVIPVVTNPGQTNGTEGVTLDSVLASMLTFPGWPSGVSVTNAVGVIKLNGSTITAAANAIDFLSGSNVVVKATNTAGTVTVQINGAPPMNTNLQVKSLAVFGQQTNYGGSYLRFDDTGTETMYMFGGLFGPGLYGVSELSLGVPTKAIKLTGTGNGQLSYSSAPYGNIGSPTLYGVAGVYATNIVGANVRPTSMAASSLARTDSSTNLAVVTVGSGLTFDGTTLSVASGGGGGGGGPASYTVLPASGIIGGTQYGYATNLSANQMLIVSNLTEDIHYFVEVKSAGFVASISNYQAIFFMAEQQGGVSALSTNGVSALEVWKDSVSGRTNAMLHGPEFALAADPGISFSTNNLTRVLTLRQDWSVSASVTNVNGVSNYVGSVSNLAQTKQLGSANLTNWSSIPTGAMANVVSTTFLTNWANAISNLVGSASGTNFNGTVTTNLSRYIVTHYGDSTNITVPVNQTNTADWYPASNAAMTLSGSFVADQAQTLFVTIALTNASITSVVLPVADANGTPIVLKTPPSTNLLAIRWDGTRMFGESGLSTLNTSQFSADGSSIKDGYSTTNAIIYSGGFIPPLQPYGSTNWSLVFDEEFTHDTADTAGFIGREYWLRSSSGAVGVPQRPGLMAFGTHDIVLTNAGHRQAIYVSAYTDTAPSGLYLTNCEWKALFRFRSSATNDATDVMGYRIGLHDALSSEATQGAYLLLTNNIFSLATANTTRNFNTGLGSNLVANSWFVCGLQGDSTGTNVVMWLGGSENAMTPVATNSANLPTAVVSPAIYFHKYAGATTRVTNTTDYFKVWYRRLSP